MKKYLAIALSLVLAIGILGIANVPMNAQQIPGNASPLSHVGGTFYASAFSTWHSIVLTGNAAAGATSIVVTAPTAMLDGTTLPIQQAWSSVYLTAPFVNDGNAETATAMTAVTYATCPSGNLGVGGSPLCATLTGTFASTHGQGATVQDGTFGLTSAAATAAALGGGQVVVDQAWTQLGGTSAMLNALAVVYPTISILDARSGSPRIWNGTPAGLALAAPTLPAVNIAGQAACDATHQMCSDATVAGSASWGGTVYTCWTYVDIYGNEGPCSATTSWTSVAGKAIDLGIPAASPGAVGAVPYLSLSTGTYILAYQIPVTSTVCTMTTLETITPACAVTNATYGQTGSTYGALSTGLFTTGGAQITTYPVNTAMTYPTLATTAATLTGQHAMTNSSVSYKYAPGSRVGACNISSANMVQYSATGGINGSSATTVPNPIASWTIPAGCFNYIGAEFRVSGKWTYTDGGDSSTRLIVAWDSNVTDTASVPTPLCNMLDTATGTGAAYNGTYTCTVRILTAAVAAGTGGTAMVNGYSTQNLAAGATTLVRNGADTAVAASAAINTYSNARIVVWFEGVGATNNPGAQSLEATLEALN